MTKDRSQSLPGKTTDRIKSGEIAAGKVERGKDEPSTEAVRAGEGHSMGDGATTRGGNKGAS